MSFDFSVLAGIAAAVVAFVFAFMRRGDKIKTLKGVVEAQKEVDDVVEKMGTSVPGSFHIDRMLAEHEAAKRANSPNSGEGNLP